MTTLQGQCVCEGIAIGRIKFYRRKDKPISRRHIQDINGELRRLHRAKEQAVSELGRLYEKNRGTVGESNAMIFRIHQMLLEDVNYLGAITEVITEQQLNAEYAVTVAADNFSQMFFRMEDDYMRARATDVKDVSDRLLGALTGIAESRSELSEPTILAAEDLVPSEAVQLDREFVLGFVTKQGSSHSHTAILARTMSLPAISGMGEELSEQLEGRLAILDGESGQLLIDPEAELIEKYSQMQRKGGREKAELSALKGKENITADGKRIDVYANIGSLSDIDEALQNDAGGIGLFRSEFLFRQNTRFPSEEEQFAVYRAAAEKMGDMPVVIRTMDIGADKPAACCDMPKEPNPAMGLRSIRLCLERPELLRTQLRASYRAAVYGRVSVMFPLIISVKEVREVKQIAASVRAELKAEGVPFREAMPLGIMIETPAAALISDQLAKEADFFSIGTNDLTQYTLALDRQNGNLERFFEPYHPALLRLIQLTAENAHRYGICVGICGEAAADPNMTEAFLSMGIDSLSVPPSVVLNLRQTIRGIDTTRPAAFRLP